MYLFLVDVFHVFFVSDVVTDLHLLLDQVFRLNESANELLALLSLEVAHFILVYDIGDLELLFSGLELVLLVDEFLSQDALLVIEIEEDTEILGHFIVLLGLDDSFDLALLSHLLFDLVNLADLLLGRVGDEALFLLTVDLGLQVPLLPELLFEERLVVLVEFSGLPERHLESSCRCLWVSTICACRVLEHLLLDSLVGFVCWSKVGGIEFSLAIEIDNLLVELAALILVPDRNEQVLLVELHRFELCCSLENLGIFLS